MSFVMNEIKKKEGNMGKIVTLASLIILLSLTMLTGQNYDESSDITIAVIQHADADELDSDRAMIQEDFTDPRIKLCEHRRRCTC